MGKRTVLSKHNVKRTKTIDIEWEDILNVCTTIPEDYLPVNTIAKMVGMSISQTRVKLKNLLSIGKVSVVKYKNCNYYRINNEKV